MFLSVLKITSLEKWVHISKKRKKKEKHCTYICTKTHALIVHVFLSYAESVHSSLKVRIWLNLLCFSSLHSVLTFRPKPSFYIYVHVLKRAFCFEHLLEPWKSSFIMTAPDEILFHLTSPFHVYTGGVCLVAYRFFFSSPHIMVNKQDVMCIQFPEWGV